MRSRKIKVTALIAAAAALIQSIGTLPIAPASAENTGVSTVYAAADTQIISGAAYHIQSVMSSKLLTAAEEGNVHQWEDLSQLSQQWRIYHLSDGYCKIVSAADPTKVLTVETADGTDGANICIADDMDAESQQFKIEKDSAEYYITTKSSDGKSSLDVYNVSAENGANIC